MKTTIILFAAMLLLPFGQAVDAEEPKAAALALEKKLHGEWKGGDRVGDIVFRSDGTFERRNHSPGNHTLKGVWELQWKSLPPTLALTCRESTNPAFVDTVLSVGLIRLNDDEFAWQATAEKEPTRFDRRLRVRARAVLGGPQEGKVADIEPWISKVVKADHASAMPKSDWITLSAESRTLEQGNGHYIDGRVTEEKGEFKVEIEGCAGVRLEASAKLKPGEKTVVHVMSGSHKIGLFVALEVIEKK